MKSILKYVVSCLLLMTSATVFSQQNFQGKAYYQSKTTMDLDGFGGRQMTEERKKMIMERMKNMLEKTYILTFNTSESIYKEEEKLAAPGQGGGFRFMSSFSSGAQYKNVKNKMYLLDQEFFGKQFLVHDSLPKLEWTMESGTKQIGQYTCFKATTVKPIDEFDWRSMRRRRNNDQIKTDSTQTKKDSIQASNPIDEIETPKQVVVTAWYTPQIPVSQGPGDYHGLPGLILEINADRTTILCSKIVLNPEEKVAIKAPEKGKVVTKKEYNKIVKAKMEEMREMYGGRGRGRGNFHRN